MRSGDPCGQCSSGTMRVVRTKQMAVRDADGTTVHVTKRWLKCSASRCGATGKSILPAKRAVLDSRTCLSKLAATSRSMNHITSEH